jgi:hypothetical protein
LQTFLPITVFAWSLLTFLAGMCSLLHAPGLAAPLAHKGSIIVSGEFDPQWSFLTITPTLTRTSGVGPALHWLEPETGSGSDGGDASQELWSLVALTQRLHRWNGEHYQANLWAGAGAGVLTLLPGEGDPSENRFGWSPWAQADWETRSLYLGATARWFQAAEIARLMTSARAGVALTAADYNRWQPWLMVEARTMEGMEEKVEITPLLRVIHRRILAEAGVSTGGAARFNLTYTF